MRFYLVYLYKSCVVDIIQFDDEKDQLAQHTRDGNLPEYLQHIRYDSIQIFNQVT